MQTSHAVNSVDAAIGSVVREQRVFRQKSVAETADALCVSESLYALCEAGKIAFQAGDLFALADLFGIRARDLMPSKDDLTEVDTATRYGEPQEVRDLIYYFSGVVSPSLRGFFLKQIEDASIQGQRAGLVRTGHRQKSSARKIGSAFGFLRAG